MDPILVMLNLFQHLLPKAILTQILEILKEILKQVQDDKTVQHDKYRIHFDAIALGRFWTFGSCYAIVNSYADLYWNSNSIGRAIRRRVQRIGNLGGSDVQGSEVIW